VSGSLIGQWEREKVDRAGLLLKLAHDVCTSSSHCTFILARKLTDLRKLLRSPCRDQCVRMVGDRRFLKSLLLVNQGGTGTVIGVQQSLLCTDIECFFREALAASIAEILVGVCPGH
jgi:hypothetical protein